MGGKHFKRMIIMKKTTIFSGLLAVLLAGGCAVGESDSGNADELRYLDVWAAENYGVTAPSGMGIYILEDEPGTGPAYNGEDFIYVTYTIKSLDGTISSSTDEQTNKQLGTYSKSAYYGPTVWYAGGTSLSVGVEDMIKDMKIGGTRTALIPSWLLGTTRYKKSSKYFSTTTGSSPAIYTISIKDAFDDTTEWELDSLDRILSPMDTVSYGFYYIKTGQPTSTEEFASDTTVYINYIGKLLNGKVFDTNVADTAKFYGIYSSSRSYGPVAVKWGSEVTDLEMGTLSSSGSYSYSTPIEGFQRTLWQMHPGEKGVGFFYSGLGYGYSGSGSSIPPYSPLVFQIEMTEEE